MPMIGCGMAVSVLVGQYLGKNRDDIAEKSTYSGFHLTFVYMATIALAYVLFPNVFLDPFTKMGDPESFAEVSVIGIILLRFVAVYSIFDTMNIIFSSAIKGAGDTRFVMKVGGAGPLLLALLPIYFFVFKWGASPHITWMLIAFYALASALIYFWRFRSEKWKVTVLA